MTFSRRKFVAGSALAAGAALASDSQAAEATPDKKLKVLVAGGHPDDPETGCGGTIARYADLGHDVVVVYLTRGEAGIKDKTHDEAAAIRTAEAKKACEILGARALFAGQIDGATEVSADRYDAFRKIIAAEQPDVLFTHWPVDTHRDHRACSLLVFDAWLNLGRRSSLYYFEVDLGAQTACFRPTHYVDIAATEPRKRAACFAHESQNPAGFYGGYHEKMQQFRGMESGHKYAEAFVHHDQSPFGRLP
jgi:N-acetylglucosamine malate deacetylase 1